MKHIRTFIGTILAATLVAFCLPPAQALGAMVFESIQDPAFIGLGAGPDGFIGTPDDVQNLDNINGTVTYVTGGWSDAFVDGITFTINEPFIFENGESTITDFSLLGRVRGGGLLGPLDVTDIPSTLPHEIVTNVLWRQVTLQTIGECFGAPCTEANAVLAMDQESTGFFLLRGNDPNLLPGIDPSLASYLNMLSGMVPPNWTTIYVSQQPPTLWTPENLRGMAATLFYGNTTSFVAAYVSTDPIEFVVIPEQIEIDIRPWSDVNPVNPFARGVIPVAILGSESFDVADVDVTTLAFGPDGAAPAHQVGGHPWDVDGDGLTDLLSHYRTQETGIAVGDTEACVTGETLDGMPLEGCDFINTEPPCGNGYAAAFVVLPVVLIGGRMRRRRG
jgi:hypothetical protein